MSDVNRNEKAPPRRLLLSRWGKLPLEFPLGYSNRAAAVPRCWVRDIEVEPLSECITTHPILRAPRRFHTTSSNSLKRCTTIHSNLRAPRRFYTTSSRLLKRGGAGWQNLRPIVKIGLPLSPENLRLQWLSFAACRYAGQVGNLRPIGNRPLRPATRQFLV